MTVVGPSLENGTGMQLWDCGDSIEEERWQLQADGHVRGFGGKCLEAVGDFNGARVELWDCSNRPGQKWQLRNGELRVFSDRCLEPRGPRLEAGTPLQVWECRGLDYHQWRFT